jgi:pimeloyl-ACP methyl ester carboxylesterase
VTDIPETRFADSGDVSIAYQAFGAGPLDLVFVPGFVSHIELSWSLPGRGDFLRSLAEFARVIQLDKRGTGRSDRVRHLPTLETRVEDLKAVLDAAGSERAALFGIDAGGSTSILFATTYPERTAALILFGTSARYVRSDDHPFGPTSEEFVAQLARDTRRWGTLEHGLEVMKLYAPSLSAGDDDMARDWSSYFRESASPETFRSFQQINMDIDVCDLLPSVDVPTLVAHRSGDRVVELGAAEFLAERIPNARFVELPGEDHTPFTGEVEPLLAATREFLGEVAPPIRT